MRWLYLWNSPHGGSYYVLYVHSKHTTAQEVSMSLLEVIMIYDDVSGLTAEEERQILVCAISVHAQPMALYYTSNALAWAELKMIYS